MDSLSQIVLGGAVGEAALGKKAGNKAIVWGAVAGTIPDLDILPSQFMEAVARIEFHRSVTHSILFALLCSPALAWIVKKIHKKIDASLLEWTNLFFWSFFTHALLDCCTTWGTQLFWPFLDSRIAWKNISVVDPLYTIPFLGLLIAVMFKDKNALIRRRLNWAGLAISTGYLFLTFINQQVMFSAFEKELNTRNIQYSRLTLIPTIFNNALWRGIAESDKGYHIGFASVFDRKLQPEFSFFPGNHDLWDAVPEDGRLNRLAAITDGYYILRRTANGLVLSDLRFGQTAGWESPDAPFIFNYDIVPDNNGKVHIARARPPFDRTDAGKLFSSLATRIKGKKPLEAGE